MELALKSKEVMNTEVQWTSISSLFLHGITTFDGTSFNVMLQRTNARRRGKEYPGGNFELVPVSPEKPPAGKNRIPLPDRLLPFIGQVFSIDGQSGALLRKKPIPARHITTSTVNMDVLSARLTVEVTDSIFMKFGQLAFADLDFG